MSLAVVFPGQGSQSVGMLGALYAAEAGVRATFAAASTVLGYDLWQLCAAGPEPTLNATERTQPAMLTAGVAVWRVWHDRCAPAVAVLAGHSLGEITALVCGGALEFEEAVAIAQFRGRVMQEAMPAGQGAMAAILGLEDAAIEEACRAAAQGEVVEPVNYNAPGQLVIAGHAGAVARAIEICKSKGAKRALPLPVSVPAHSSLLQGAAARLGARLADARITAPRVPVYALGLKRHDSPQAIRANLVAQLSRAVRWSDTIRDMVEHGTRAIVECGPGRVLTALNRRIERGREITPTGLDDPVTLTAIDDPESLAQACAQ